jgi:hypothetical protein
MILAITWLNLLPAFRGGSRALSNTAQTCRPYPLCTGKTGINPYNENSLVFDQQEGQNQPKSHAQRIGGKEDAVSHSQEEIILRKHHFRIDRPSDRFDLGRSRRSDPTGDRPE